MSRNKVNYKRHKRVSHKPLEVSPGVLFYVAKLFPKRNIEVLGAVVICGMVVAAVPVGVLHFLTNMETKSLPNNDELATLRNLANSPEVIGTDPLKKTRLSNQPSDGANPSSLDSNTVSKSGKSLPPEFLPSLDSKKINERIQVLRQQLQLKPKDGVNRSALASLLEAGGNLQEAEKHYRKAVADSPSYSPGRHSYGMFLVKKRHRVTEGISHLQVAAELTPDLAQIRTDLGFAFGEKGNMSAAIEQFELALKLNPSHVATHFFLASALDEMGSLEKSAEHFRMASKLQPGYYAAHYGLGSILARQGDLAEALKQFRLTTISPNSELRTLAQQAINYLELRGQKIRKRTPASQTNDSDQRPEHNP